ncbi:RagB/SusD family nutrient uptake outer membrane protein [Dysgonomonas sp.]
MKIKIYHILILLAAMTFTACNDWLDVTPKDRVLEDEQFSTEDNIYNATNGLYRELVSKSLYGGNLTQTTLDMMGHIYTYPPDQPGTTDKSVPFYNLAHSRYASDQTKGIFADIWKSAYAALLHINVYIKNLEESQGVVTEKNKKILLGEAYGLRAYLHFDIFRLFGPVYLNRNENKILPYNKKSTVTINHTGYEESEYSTADEYIALLLKDIEKAESLLKDNDPIVTDPKNSVTDKLDNTDFFRNRNRRMNFYAVTAFKARVLQYIGRDEDAAPAAKILTDLIEADNVFKWVKTSGDDGYTKKSNYIFFSEVIFGIDNLEQYSNATKWYNGTELRTAYVVDYNHIMKNIYPEQSGGITDPEKITDIRSKQWLLSDVTQSNATYSREGTYRSRRYSPVSSEDSPALKSFQPLIRISEMYYIQAEAALKAGDAATMANRLNSVLRKRGLTEQFFLTGTETEGEIREHIEREYYREFFGEGQVFFFNKRRNSSQIFKGYGEGKERVESYVVPIPEEETNI